MAKMNSHYRWSERRVENHLQSPSRPFGGFSRPGCTILITSTNRWLKNGRFMTIPQRHISEMEKGKRPIDKENSRKLEAAINVDCRAFLQFTIASYDTWCYSNRYEKN
jgi:hypothetical protein